jgi:hypothetical protein
LEATIVFKKAMFPGYLNKKGSGKNCDKSFPASDAAIFTFSRVDDFKGVEQKKREEGEEL